ncbi:hypothetical protein DMB90_04135 [Raoultella planticola]|uniref:Uncharacterized protein n=1 Tax=Raoultella planticola TaxID=575 RepID=A0A5P6A972_RAOPL|nr:hypothetical protein DMB90_04135 [Raoultella planticola]
MEVCRVEDIGIVENGKLACTANWGMLDKPRRFPPKNMSCQMAIVFTKELKLSPVRSGSRYEPARQYRFFTSSFAFSAFSRQHHGFNFSLTSLNGEHVFLNDVKSAVGTGASVSVSLCSGKYDICSHLTERKQGFSHSLRSLSPSL